MKRIVFMGGGSGISNLLHTCSKEGDWQISAIIATSDSGGSTGIIRDFYDIPALGDIVKNLSSLKSGNEWMVYRFGAGFLDGHTTGNIWLLGLMQTYGFVGGIKKAHELLGHTSHKVIPATEEVNDICLSLPDKIIAGEGPIIQCQTLSHRVQNIQLKPAVKASEEVITAIKEADIIVLGPGTLYTSLIACLLPSGISEAWRLSKAKKLYIANAANFPPGHCDGYVLGDYLRELYRCADIGDFDGILAHDGAEIPEQQKVLVDVIQNTTVSNILAQSVQNIGGKFDSIERNTLRHDGEKVVQWIKKFFH